ncbi:hypothetical protein HJB67_12900 [Rhizobium lentis]|uniref:ribosomal protein L7/L12 n=1 Tax=Rhizobium lentis TaxID=1138194 RepID=UPI001C828B98|nr:ribosomal protein L7/L12 [Rhizobium lentis]MBX5010853.1 hypothetical protein [Rhizobium lentis]
MAKFKVGDRVRFVENYGRANKGDEATVTGFFADDVVRVDVDNDKGTHSCFMSRVELVPAVQTWRPKVGDRVVWQEPFKASMYTKGKEYLIHKEEYGTLFITDDNGNLHHSWNRENIPGSFSLVVPLTIEAGKFYKTRDGRKVGPAFIRDNIATFGELNNWASAVWADDGRHSERSDKTSKLNNDIIAEWVDEPAEQPAVAVAASNDNAVPAKFKVGDKIRHKSLGHTGHVTKIVGDDHAEVFWTNVGWGATDPFAAIELLTKPTPTAIVALIEDGQPKPATRPYVHATEAAAAKEAARLAEVHKGQQFGVYVLTTTSQEPAPTYAHEWQRLAAKGEKIAAIKELRGITGLGLKATKDAVEYWLANDEPRSRIAA